MERGFKKTAAIAAFTALTVFTRPGFAGQTPLAEEPRGANIATKHVQMPSHQNAARYGRLEDLMGVVGHRHAPLSTQTGTQWIFPEEHRPVGAMDLAPFVRPATGQNQTPGTAIEKAPVRTSSGFPAAPQPAPQPHPPIAEAILPPKTDTIRSPLDRRPQMDGARESRGRTRWVLKFYVKKLRLRMHRLMRKWMFYRVQAMVTMTKKFSEAMRSPGNQFSKQASQASHRDEFRREMRQLREDERKDRSGREKERSLQLRVVRSNRELIRMLAGQALEGLAATDRLDEERVR